MHAAAVRLRSAGGTQYVRRIAQNFARARLSSTPSSQIKAPHVDKYLLRDGNVIGQLEALLCDVGSRVHEDEETAVIETDKVAISVRAPESGVVTAVLKGVGDWVAVGDPVYAFAPEAAAVGERQWAAERARELADARRLQDAHDAQVMAEIERQARARNEARAFERRAQAARAEAFRRMRRDREEFAQSSAGWRWRQSRRRAQPPPGGGGDHSGGGAHAVLGVRPGASRAEIKAAFRRKALRYHPDRDPSDGARRKFLDARRALDVLLGG